MSIFALNSNDTNVDNKDVEVIDIVENEGEQPKNETASDSDVIPTGTEQRFNYEQSLIVDEETEKTIVEPIVEDSQTPDLQPQQPNENSRNVDIPVQEVEALGINVGVSDLEPALNIPYSKLKQIFTNKNVLPITVHGIVISIDLKEFETVTGADVNSGATLNALTATLELELSPSEVIAIRDKQLFSYKTGASIISPEEDLEDTSVLKIIVPQLSKNIQIEEANIESVDFGESLTMIDIDPKCTSKTLGLNKIIKKSSLVKILNSIQESSPRDEYLFYAKIISNMEDTNTFSRSLGDLRLMMQYALNCDTILLQSIVTNIVVSNEEEGKV